MLKPVSGAFELPNIRRFIAFRIFFNSRFYYPVFTVLFLDFGLSLEQFAVLNAVWAATIVLFEVPSGALADVIGRKNLLVTSATLMVIEIGVLCIVPRGKGVLLFIAFLVNRILSGMAEAFASGADEALAYDTLKVKADPADWGHVLERQMRYRSIGFIAASIVGAALYDPHMVESALKLAGIHSRITQDHTLRLPLYLTFVMALGAWFATFGMTEPVTKEEQNASRKPASRLRAIEALTVTVRAGIFIFRNPLALAIILSGMMIDHVARMIITLASQYYRSIAIPEAAFGWIGAALAVSGIFVPRIALKMSQTFSKSVNLWLVSAGTLLGIWGMTRFWPVWGLIPALLLFSTMMMSGFFCSRYLNDITSSTERATVLSFKGMLFNLAYGLIGIAYAVLIARLRESPAIAAPGLSGPGLEDAVFKGALRFFPAYFLLIFVLLMVFLIIYFRLISGDKTGKYGSS